MCFASQHPTGNLRSMCVQNTSRIHKVKGPSHFSRDAQVTAVCLGPSARTQQCVSAPVHVHSTTCCSHRPPNMCLSLFDGCDASMPAWPPIFLLFVQAARLGRDEAQGQGTRPLEHVPPGALRFWFSAKSCCSVCGGVGGGVRCPTHAAHQPERGWLWQHHGHGVAARCPVTVQLLATCRLGFIGLLGTAVPTCAVAHGRLRAYPHCTDALHTCVSCVFCFCLLFLSFFLDVDVENPACARVVGRCVVSTIVIYDTICSMYCTIPPGGLGRYRWRESYRRPVPLCHAYMRAPRIILWGNPTRRRPNSPMIIVLILLNGGFRWVLTKWENGGGMNFEYRNSLRS